MFVYLDTSQIIDILRSTSSSSETYKVFLKDFFQQWNKKGIKLCLSLSHLNEISYSDDRKSIEEELMILESFEDIRLTELGWPSIVEQEIISQLIYIIKGIKFRWPKEKLWKKTNSKFLKDYIRNNLNKLRKSRNIYQAASDIEELFKPARLLINRHLKINMRTRRVIDLKDNSSNRLDSIWNIIEQLDSLKARDGKSNIFIKNIVRSARETGSLASALLKLCKIEELYDAEKRYLNDVSSLSVFMKLGRESIPKIAKITGVEENKILQYISKINPLRCPGFALRMALLRALKSSYKKYKPSDWKDADHIVYAPYVNIFFVDKRTHEFLNQETKNQAFSIEKSFLSNIRRIVPLKELLNNI